MYIESGSELFQNLDRTKIPRSSDWYAKLSVSVGIYPPGHPVSIMVSGSGLRSELDPVLFIKLVSWSDPKSF